MDRRHFGKTTLALSSSLLLPGQARGKVDDIVPLSPIKNIISLYFFKNLFNDPYNLVLMLDLKKGRLLQRLLIKGMHLHFLPTHPKLKEWPLELNIIKNIGHIFVPVLQCTSDGYFTHRHNVKVNLEKTWIIRKTYIPADKIGSLNITAKA